MLRVTQRRCTHLVLQLELRRCQWSAPKNAAVKEKAVKAYESARNYYEDFTGMPQIRAAQNEVIQVKEKLQNIQNQRHPLMLALERTREELQEVTKSISKTDMGSDLYLELVKRNINLIQREKADQNRYNQLREEEQKAFTDLTVAIRQSHELELNQSAHFKHLSWIISILCGSLTVVVVMVKYLSQSAEHKNEMLAIKALELKQVEHYSDLKEEIQRQFRELKAHSAALHKENTSFRDEKPASSSAESWLWWAAKPVIYSIKAIKFW